MLIYLPFLYLCSETVPYVIESVNKIKKFVNRSFFVLFIGIVKARVCINLRIGNAFVYVLITTQTALDSSHYVSKKRSLRKDF